MTLKDTAGQTSSPAAVEERRSDVPMAIRTVWRLEGVAGMVNGLSYRVDDGPPPARRAPG